MKKLVVLGLIGLICFYGQPKILSFIGFGKAKYGVNDKDPLGVPAKIDALLKGSNFEGDFGTVNTVRTIAYKSTADQKTFPDMGGGVIIVSVGEEEYIQSIKAVFVGTTHGYSPQRPGVTETIMGNLWKDLGGPGKLNYTKINDGALKIPASVKFGRAVSIPYNHMEATFDTSDIKGKWAYSTDMPFDYVELALK